MEGYFIVKYIRKYTFMMRVKIVSANAYFDKNCNNWWERSEASFLFQSGLYHHKLSYINSLIYKPILV